MSNNFEPIIGSFDIKAQNPDSTNYLINVSPLFTNDVKALTGLRSDLRKELKVKSLDKNRSFIESVKSFPINIEVKHVTTFDASEPNANQKTETVSLLMNQSFILLPDEQMKMRYLDERVGWFNLSHVDYSSDALKADRKSFIKRWKLIPKDKEAYLKGELVEPIKQIVYYLDPATPLKWRPYFKQGIEDWNQCFETAGFKNAIIAKDPPTPDEDSEFSPEDARYSVVRYVASTTRNAVGPSVADPRTGEIIESDIIWYHNHLRSYRNRYMLETGAANPKARGIDTPDEEIGEMMRRVISHEVGHALGLPHNMKASAAYPVDSLRSGKFTQKYGIATTIMDYARYNYVAQPGDQSIRFVRQIGPYDHYAINWGYRYFGEDSDVDRKELLTIVKEKEGDPMFEFGGGRGRLDPDSQTENIGDDNIIATEYGIKNLKIVGVHLIEWTTKEGDNYSDLDELYGEFLGVWRRYIGHIIPNIGGINITLKTSDQTGAVLQYVDKQKQIEAVDYLLKNGLSPQKWLCPTDITNRIGYRGSLERITNIQVGLLKSLLSEDRLQRMLQNEFENGKEAYTVLELFDQLHKSIWIDVRGPGTPNMTQRLIQRNMVDILIDLLSEENDKTFLSDLSPLVRHELNRINQAVYTHTTNKQKRIHYDFINHKIDSFLFENSKKE